MTRNESNLEFQKRLMKVARRSPKYEALRMMSIVYDNLIEFARVRVPLDPNPSSIMEKYVDALEYFMQTLQAKFTTFFLQNDLSMVEDMVPVITTKIKEHATSHNIDSVTALKEVYHTAYFGNYGFMHMGTYVHPIVMQMCYGKVKDNLGLGKEDLPPIIASNKLNMVIMGDRRKIAAPPHYFGSNMMAMLNVRRWLDEKMNDQFISSGITLTFTTAHPEDIRDYSGTVYLEHYRYDSRRKYLMKRVETPNGSFETADKELFHSQLFTIRTNNALLINFSNVAKMILANTGDTLAGELSYHESSDWIKGMHGVIWENKKCKGDEMDIIYRTPGDKQVLWKVFDAIGLNRSLGERILNTDTLKDMQSMVAAWKKKPSVAALDAISDSYMTFYRSGLVINFCRDDGEYNPTIVDFNVKFAVVMALYLGKRAHFFIEIRARDSERENLQLVNLLLRCGADVHVVSVDLYDKKVHAKFWLFARGLCQSDVVVTSTGNFTTDSQTNFADTYHISNITSYVPPYTCHSNIVNAMTVLMSNIKAKDMNGDIDSVLIWKPKQIKQYILYKINELAEMKRRNPNRNPVIWIKCNHLTDPDICKALNYAGYYGVNVRLIVRTTCLFASPDTDDNYIRIYSVAGKYLEHDRYYIFDDGEGNYEGGISSADLMHRNLSERVEFLERLSSEQCQALVEKVMVPMVSNGSSPKEGFYVFYLNH